MADLKDLIVHGTAVFEGDVIGIKIGDGAWIGTKAEWAALSEEEKNKWIGKEVIITDDTTGGGGSGKDPLDDDNWVDLRSVVSHNSLISELTTFLVRRINGVIYMKISFVWGGPRTTQTQSSVITNIPNKYWSDSQEFLMSGYSNDALVSVGNCRIDSSGLHIDENNWPEGTRVKVATPYLGRQI